jgi:hypothetical protein
MEISEDISVTLQFYWHTTPHFLHILWDIAKLMANVNETEILQLQCFKNKLVYVKLYT